MLEDIKETHRTNEWIQGIKLIYLFKVPENLNEGRSVCWLEVKYLG